MNKILMLKNSIRLRSNFKHFCTSDIKPKFDLLKPDAFIKQEFKDEKNINNSMTLRSKTISFSPNDNIETLKQKLSEASLEENLMYYEQNKNKMSSENFLMYLKYLCIKMEHASFDDLYTNIQTTNKDNFQEIEKRFMTESLKIDSKEKVLVYSLFIYLMHFKKNLGLNFDTKEHGNRTRLINFFFKGKQKDFTFFDKLSFLSHTDFSKSISYEEYLKNDFYEIENIGFFELSRIIKRVVYYKLHNLNKQKLLEILNKPYTKMALEVNLMNKVYAFNYMSKINHDISFMDLQSELEDLFKSIKADINDYSEGSLSIDPKEVENGKWIYILLKALKFYKGEVERSFVDQVYKIFFENKLVVVMTKTNFSFFKNLNVLYHISLLDKELMPEEKHMKIFYSYLKNNLITENLPQNLIVNHMMGIFALMHKSGVEIDKVVLKQSIEFFLGSVHKFAIVEISHSFKHLVKSHFGLEFYEEKVKKEIITNLYNQAITLPKEKIDPWLNIISILCFYAETRSPQTDSIFDLFLQALDFKKSSDPVFLPRFLIIYVYSIQVNLFPEYKSKFTSKVFSMLTKESIEKMSSMYPIAQIYIALTRIKIQSEEEKKSILAIMSHIHELKMNKVNFFYCMRSLVEDGYSIGDSTIISIMLTVKILCEEKAYSFNSQIQENLILMLYSALSKGAEIDEELLNIFVKFIDRIANTNKISKVEKLARITISFEETLSILLMFLKRGLISNMLLGKFYEQKDLFSSSLENRLLEKIEEVTKLIPIVENKNKI